ncbi:patatin-like phospholipase family protein [Mucilaginibacter agri]|uniref:PNPLA domain-containing protein n=1 Tax=Mucilaginibacter agri TaxID=2695265 RepID=A0A965ZF96_9SPHI|nr:patatin-like phospholipase family protein [Mucilaginibacter agri]NCD68671.1 hypothetical protein [Mucilaginibacter agri]
MILNNEFDMAEVTKNTTFHAGICMAGAVSAGAYTAGVMDYLFEALEHWQKAKDLQEAGKLSGIPKHNFIVETLGGASAGGMTAAITAGALQGEFEPVKQADADNDAQTKQNPLYNAWVNLTETPTEDMMHFMLDTSDIENDSGNASREVRAGFNSTFIKQVANAVLDSRYSPVYNREYLADDLDIFTTITNLRGFNYKIAFDTSSGVREYSMKMHRDYAFFKLSEDAYTGDGRIPISFDKTPKVADNGTNIEMLKAAAMSTGAFPVGLESRTLSRQRAYIEDSKYLNLKLAGEDDKKVTYNFLPEGAFVSLNVDGGVINNEPFEVTQQLLDDRRRDVIIQESIVKAAPVTAEDRTAAEAAARLTAKMYSPQTSATEFDSLVVMIDPFPNDAPPEPAVFVPQQAWRNVVPAVLGAMIGQLRMKEDQVKRAYLSDDYTRYLIMPVREANGVSQQYTIACGSLGGFGGFFSKAFRKHDFYLGRRNCQRFLQAHFNVPESAQNPILAFGFENVTDFKYTDSTGVTYLPMIPDLRVVEDKATGTFTVAVPPEESVYPYPQIKLTDLLRLKDPMENRIKCILNNVQNAAVQPSDTPKWQSQILPKIHKQSWFSRTVGGFFKDKGLDLYLSLGKSFGKGAVADMFLDEVIKDMEQRGLIDDDYKG